MGDINNIYFIMYVILDKILSMEEVKVNFQDIYYAITVDREKSITKASNVLYVSQPSLSQCIQKLEKELNITIFKRTSKGVEPTDEGEIFLAFAKKVYTLQKDFETKLCDKSTVNSGKVVVGFTGTQATYVLPYFLPNFKKLYPNINIVLEEATSDNIEKMLEEKTVDIGIIHPPILNNNLDFFELSVDKMIVVPRKESNYLDFVYDEKYINLNFFKKEEICTTYPWQRSHMITMKILENANINPLIKKTCRNLSTLDALAQVEYSSVFLPEKQISDNLKKEKEYFFIDEDLNESFSFCVATLKGSYISNATKILLEYLKKIQYSF